MGIFDSITELFDNAVSGIFPSSSGSYLGGSGGGSPSAGPSFPLNYSYPAQSYTVPEYTPVMAQAPMIVGGAAMIGRSLMTRFPNLYASVVALSQQFGRRFTPEMIWRMLKQQGPGMVVGLIGAGAMNELFVWKTTHKTRRMNPANARALRRSMRRLKSFDRLASRVNVQLHRKRSSGRRVGRCGTCRKSPCCC